MPLYEYRCCSCGSRFEVLRRMGQGAEGLACPACGRAEVEKEHSTFAGSVSGGSASGASAGGGAGCAPSGRFT